jgi:hypothetical protein
MQRLELRDLQNPRIQAQVLGRASARNHECVIVGFPHRVEVEVQREVVARLLAVGLVTLEVVDGRPDLLARALPGTDGIASRLSKVASGDLTLDVASGDLTPYLPVRRREPLWVDSSRRGPPPLIASS